MHFIAIDFGKNELGVIGQIHQALLDCFDRRGPALHHALARLLGRGVMRLPAVVALGQVGATEKGLVPNVEVPVATI